MTLSLPISRRVTSLRDLKVDDVVICRDPGAISGVVWCIVTEANDNEPDINMVAMSCGSLKDWLEENWRLREEPSPWLSFLDSGDNVELVLPENVPDTFWAALARLKLTGEPTVF